jgi:5-(carboxyamino)imidazole ribonucleotide synthase
MIPVIEPLGPGAAIGILGGGQLGRMLALAAADLGFNIHIYEPEADCPAARVSASVTTAPWDDLEALGRFARGVEAVTFEFENVPAASLANVAALVPIRPGIRSLELTQDRWVEKQFIQSLGLLTAPYAPVSSMDDFHEAAHQLGPNGILKTRRFGYDGKGQIAITSDSDLAHIWENAKGQDWIFEGLVDFACEVSLTLARGADGQIAAFDLTQNTHRNGILHSSFVPAEVSLELSHQALIQATEIAQALGHIGVLAVEFFLTRDGALIVNEIAPRVHNSAHWTQDGCNASQFVQHIRAVAGWSLGDPSRHAGHVQMTNLIGADVDDWAAYASEAGTFLHLYGKREVRAGRKMGHVNRVKPGT